MKRKHKILITILGILIASIVIYSTVPFLNFRQTHIYNEDDKIGVFIARLTAYIHFIDVYKGASFNEIPCHDIDGTKHTINIKFNWDNSISISENEKVIVLHIDSVCFEPTLSYGSGYDIDGEMVLEDIPDDEGYYFESLSFFDTRQMNHSDSTFYSITLNKQKSSLLNGPRRYGFELNIYDTHLSTGNMDNGHIFEY